MIPPQIAAFFASKLFKIGLGVAALLILVLSVNAGIRAVRDWQQDTFNKAFNAGYTSSDAKWSKASAENERQKMDAFAKNVDRSNTAMAGYLKDIADKAPILVPVKERTTVYAQSPSGTTVCTDADGVRLLQQYREASGLGGQARTAPAPTGPVR